MKNFNKLNFKEHSVSGFGTVASYFFHNGYGVSVITGEYAYTSEKAPYEIAVLKGNSKDSSLTYDTSITDDVVGHLTAKEVDEIMVKVKNLPKERE